MDTVDLSSPAGAAEPDTDLAQRVTIATRELASPDRIARRAFHGLWWTFRNGFDRALETAHHSVWANPAAAGWTHVKQSATRDVWRAQLAGGVYYAKYYVRRGGLAGVKRWLRGPTCLAEWRGGLYALRADIPAVRPAGYTEHVVCDGRPCSLLVTEALEPAYGLDEFWTAIQRDEVPQRRRQDARQLVERVAEMIAHAHQSGFEHLDMHAANILVQPLGARRYRTAFVDLQSARLGVPLDDRAVVRNLAQLNQWFRRQSSTADRLRFLRAYLRWRNEYESRFEHSRPLGLSFE